MIGTTKYCEPCKKDINVGTRGQKNYVEHCKSAKHKAAVEKQKLGGAILNFFKPKPPLVRSAAPEPTLLKNWTCKKKDQSSSFVQEPSNPASSSALESHPVNSLLLDDPEVVKPLRQLASLLPTSVVEGQSIIL
ncbi:hypothetical protein M422DRAFT_259208 [Sphaerobolus stellatus SS14]|uniref:Uncharacterized protein n=1 Tax=Sphaerobolus stellatus (strain SS14) TaxID=990650 RepID=A0A0C9VK28_SPHS4|nr:hypothetical protein M422DRAFT_259208 [Sphaerobolus stellatus SS14]